MTTQEFIRSARARLEAALGDDAKAEQTHHYPEDLATALEMLECACEALDELERIAGRVLPSVVARHTNERIAAMAARGEK